MAGNRTDAVKLVKRGKVFIDGKRAATRVSYHRPKTVEVKDN
jgi:16S rRNA U516 pseudouridylate synthase RsuA-like enzyme